MAVKPANGTPKYQIVKQALMDRIAGRRYSAELAVPPEKVLAKELGVAPMTARRALQELVQEGVLVRERGRGRGTFVRQGPARAANGGSADARLRRVGVIHAYDWERLQASPVYHLTFLEVQRECARRGVGLELLPAQPGDGRNPAKLARESGCQALMVLDWTEGAPELLAAAADRLPVVVAGPFQEMIPLSFVAPNDFQGAWAVTRHLLELGHPRVAMINSRKVAKASSDRQGGWAMALDRAGAEREGLLYQAGRLKQGQGEDFREIRAELLEQFRQRPPPSAVFARDGFMAIAAIGALRELGRSCPGDVSVACIGRFFEQALDAPRLTAAQYEDGALGRELLQLVEDLLAGRRTAPAGVLLPMRVVEGQTTRKAD
ncbi:MAG TPA: substrate-binding domain-containing protein [Planctomycetota bacterium]|nr:substrate-binding domain-containing protein [Planctomycetota bacterium]